MENIFDRFVSLQYTIDSIDDWVNEFKIAFDVFYEKFDCFVDDLIINSDTYDKMVLNISQHPVLCNNTGYLKDSKKFVPEKMKNQDDFFLSLIYQDHIILISCYETLKDNEFQLQADPHSYSVDLIYPDEMYFIITENDSQIDNYEYETIDFVKYMQDKENKT